MSNKTAGDKVKRLKNKKDFEDIYNSGILIYSSDKKFKAHILICEIPDKSKLLLAAAVSKKLGNGVWRNRLKRLIKESFHQSKIILADKLEKNKLLIKIIISPNLINQRAQNRIRLDETLPGISEIISSINKQYI